MESTPTPQPGAGLPQSCTHIGISLAGLLCFSASVLWLRRQPAVGTVLGAMLALGALAAPMALLEWTFLKTHRNPSTGLDFTLDRKPDPGRVGIKLLGLCLTLLVALFFYGAFPEYRQPLYTPYWEMLRLAMPALLVAAVPYFFLLDRRMAEPHDGYWDAGMLIISPGRVDRGRLAQHSLGWLVKAYFLPLMFAYFTRSLDYFRALDVPRAFSSFVAFYQTFYEGVFLVDLVFVCAGYILTVRLLDSHIRSAEPTFLGWAVALACYQPFWGFSGSRYLAYGSDLPWFVWLRGSPQLLWWWGASLIFLYGVYVWATLPFGLRFSNLTHRGILTNGPYRWTKHPAYVSKNLAWWMASAPLLASHDLGGAVQKACLLLGVNLIYYLRAVTEERHLSRDPVYVRYALAMNELSVFRGLARALPWLRYRPPASC